MISDHYHLPFCLLLSPSLPHPAPRPPSFPSKENQRERYAFSLFNRDCHRKANIRQAQLVVVVVVFLSSLEFFSRYGIICVITKLLAVDNFETPSARPVPMTLRSRCVVYHRVLIFRVCSLFKRDEDGRMRTRFFPIRDLGLRMLPKSGIYFESTPRMLQHAHASSRRL